MGDNSSTNWTKNASVIDVSYVVGKGVEDCFDGIMGGDLVEIRIADDSYFHGEIYLRIRPTIPVMRPMTPKVSDTVPSVTIQSASLRRSSSQTGQKGS